MKDPTDVPLGLFAIVLGEGELWTHQCGGYACDQRTATGQLQKLDGDEGELLLFFTGERWGGWCCDGIDEETADFIEETVPEFKVDRTKLNESCEAWILGSVGDKPAILVWENSD